jgi:NAD(P)-dependent dehydrogenase (short-subunit alcohol dehydrogenase family)
VGDLTSTTSVRALADRFKEQYGALHVLSNNAALLKLHPGRTETGVNEIIAANYLGHFLLTNLLLDLLKANAPARVITVAGQAGVVERISCPEIGLLDVPANRPLRATLNAVLAKVLFARELARRLDGSGVTSNVFHPGLVNSGLGSNLPWYLRIPYSAGNALLRESCPTSLFLALDEGVQTVTGAFFAGGRQVTYHAPEQEEVLAHRLWEESARLVGIA